MTWLLDFYDENSVSEVLYYVMNQPSDFYSFIYRQNRYHGHFTPKTLIFNANLQEFAQRVGHISNLQTNGKQSPQEAYEQIEAIWKPRYEY